MTYDHEAGARAWNAFLDKEGAGFRERGGLTPAKGIFLAGWHAAFAEIERQQRAAAPVADVAGLIERLTTAANIMSALHGDAMGGLTKDCREAAAALTRLAGELDRITKGTYSLEIARLNKSHLDAEARAERAEARVAALERALKQISVDGSDAETLARAALAPREGEGQ